MLLRTVATPPHPNSTRIRADATQHATHPGRLLAVLAVNLVLELLREIRLNHLDLRARACAQASTGARRQRKPFTAARSIMPVWVRNFGTNFDLLNTRVY